MMEVAGAGVPKSSEIGDQASLAAEMMKVCKDEDDRMTRKPSTRTRGWTSPALGVYAELTEKQTLVVMLMKRLKLMKKTQRRRDGSDSC
jgi:hypothetical protein